MTDWIITIPKTIKWQDYEKELEAVFTGGGVLSYRLPFKVNASPGDRCYVVWNGRVRGWMEIVGPVQWTNGFTCEITGKLWPPGWFLNRAGKFHKVDGPAMKGFRGIRRLKT